MQAAGDVDGDGLADLVVGAPSRGDGGSAYVVYGKADSSPITLDAIDAGSGGYAYAEPTAGERLGEHVAGIGDVNADGFPDLALTAGRYDNTGSTLYVVWGVRPGSGRLAVHDSGFSVVLGGKAPTGALAAGHDVNGDGINDVLVSRWSFDDPTSVSYVVFGCTAPGVISGAALEAGQGGGFAIFGGPVSAARPT
ncbi:MAG TPA: FG-GAP repeat protein, partial [Polyangiaceae bacterium]|nr:FG-GAP repeat protein [Polyangiaceae bacterium]